MLRTILRIRIHLISVGCALSAILLSRCSPVAPSIEKRLLQDSQTGTVPKSNSPSSPPNPITPATPQPEAMGNRPGSGNRIQVFIYKSWVIPTRMISYSDKSDDKASARYIHLAADKRAHEFSNFITDHKTTLAIDGPIPEVGTAYFEVKQSEDEINSRRLNRFNTLLKPQENGNWSLSVLGGGPNDLKFPLPFGPRDPSDHSETAVEITDAVLNSLIRVTLVFSNLSQAKNPVEK